jgi:phage/plasmid-like protein (TIGR03299 family)
MAHQIAFNSNGTAQYASTEREWHGLGQLMTRGATVEEWQKQSGMNYKVQRGVVRYATAHEQEAKDYKQIDDKVVLFRSDTKAPLGVVSRSYHVVQPDEVLEFFRGWAEQGGLTIESAGVLFGGKRYFATAKLAEGVDLGGKHKDKVVPYALLSTSADGSLATECRWTTVRTVCNNTLTMARAGSAACHRTTHRSKFQPNEARKSVEAANAEFGAFMEMARDLAMIKVNAEKAQDLTLRLFRAGKKDEDAIRASAGYNRVLGLFGGDGKGSTLDTAWETGWGFLNSVTEYADQHIRSQSEENRIASALWGQGDELKQKALDLVTALL